MIEEKDIQVGNRIAGLSNGCVFEISRIYKNDKGQDYVMITDIHTMYRYEISKEHLMHCNFEIYDGRKTWKQKKVIKKIQKVFLPENRRKALIHIEFRGMDSFRIIYS